MQAIRMGRGTESMILVTGYSLALSITPLLNYLLGIKPHTWMNDWLNEWLNEWNMFQWKGHITSSALWSSDKTPKPQPCFSLNMAKVTPVSCQKKRPKNIKMCHHWWLCPMMSTRPEIDKKHSWVLLIYYCTKIVGVCTSFCKGLVKSTEFLV